MESEANLARRLEVVAARLPAKPAFRTETGRELTFVELDELSDGIAGGLQALGVGPGDRVAVMAGSHPEFVATFYGIWKAGAIAVALNAQLGPDEARYQLQNSGARVAVCDPGRSLETVQAAAAGGEAPDLERAVTVEEAGGGRKWSSAVTRSRRSSTRRARPAFPRGRLTRTARCRCRSTC